MKRIIDPKTYAQIAQKNQDALDYPKVCSNHSVLIETSRWVCVENKYPYVEENGKACLQHYLIITKRNDVNFYEDLNLEEAVELGEVLSKLRSLSVDLEKKMMFKDSHRSIQKFHIHYLFLEP